MAITWESPIKGYLAPYVACMRGIQPQLDLGNYDSVRDNAGLMYQRLTDPDDSRRMPKPPAPRWSENKIKDFKAWGEAGYPLREWSKSSLINEVDSTPLAPAATVFKDKLYVFWKANDATSRIHFNSLAKEGGWGVTRRISDADSTSATPAACVFNNSLYLFWQANDRSSHIYFSASADGERWGGGKEINKTDATPFAPAACVFKGNLYLFWGSNDPSAQIYFSKSGDGQSWGSGQKIAIKGAYSTQDAPAVCVFKDSLYLFWRGTVAPHRVYFSVSKDGTSWSEIMATSDRDATPASPACCVAGDQLYLFLMANDPSNLIYSSRLLSRGDAFSDAQAINRTDTTVKPLAAAGFLDKPYLFWKANDNRIRFAY